VFSCKNRQDTSDTNNNIGTVFLDTKNRIQQGIDVTSLADSVRYIKLETTDESLIGNIKQVIFYDGLFFIKDNKSASIFVFDQTGKYKSKISKKGRGPGEYVGITRMMIDRKNRQIILYDIHTRKMSYYTFDGKFIKQVFHINEKGIARDVIQLPDGGFLCYNPYNDGTNYKLDAKYWGVWKVDSLGKYCKHVWTTESKYPVYYRDAKYFYELPDNKTGLWCADINDILYFSNDTVISRLSMKMDKPTISDFPGKTRDDILQTITMRLNVFETDNFILGEWLDEPAEYTEMNMSYFNSFYLKKEKKSVVADITYPRDSGFLPVSPVYFNCPDQMLGILQITDIEPLEQSGYYSDKDINLLKSFFSNPEDDNPVLEILYLKK
jgi:hypothetical protein